VTLNTPLKPDDVAFIAPGQTTLSEVVMHLGVPVELKRSGPGALARYYYTDVKYFRVNFGWPLGLWQPAAFVPHDLILGGGGLGVDLFQVELDQRWIVQQYTFTHESPAAGYRVWPFGSARDE